MLTGGCCGIPEAAAREAQKHQGLVIGVFPGKNKTEHLERYSQSEIIDINIYTGFGDAGRIPINVRSANACFLLEVVTVH